MALRKTADDKNIWFEVPPVTENIMGIDLVWKPVGFAKSQGFDIMTKRCQYVDRPFAYCHYEGIQCLSTKTGLLKTLRLYYEKAQFFNNSHYSIEHSVALSFIVPAADYMDNPELAKVRKTMNKIEKQNFFDQKLAARQLTKNLWIVKPENENRGRGIEIVSSWKELLGLMGSK